jgi:hypothetical protein
MNRFHDALTPDLPVDAIVTITGLATQALEVELT